MKRLLRYLLSFKNRKEKHNRQMKFLNQQLVYLKIGREDLAIANGNDYIAKYGTF